MEVAVRATYLEVAVGVGEGVEAVQVEVRLRHHAALAPARGHHRQHGRRVRARHLGTATAGQ